MCVRVHVYVRVCETHSGRNCSKNVFTSILLKFTLYIILTTFTIYTLFLYFWEHFIFYLTGHKNLHELEIQRTILSWTRWQESCFTLTVYVGLRMLTDDKLYVSTHDDALVRETVLLIHVQWQWCGLSLEFLLVSRQDFTSRLPFLTPGETYRSWINYKLNLYFIQNCGVVFQFTAMCRIKRICVLTLSVVIVVSFVVLYREMRPRTQSAYTVLTEPVKDTLNLHQRTNASGSFRRRVAPNTLNSREKQNAVAQIDSKLLAMIEDIERSYDSRFREVGIEPLGNFSCPPTPRTVNGVEDIMCMVSTQPPLLLLFCSISVISMDALFFRSLCRTQSRFRTGFIFTALKPLQ